MKTNRLLFFFCFIISYSSFSQEIDRIEVKGQIIADYPDLEGVTVFNISSNRGTITDAEGKFSINVVLNDRIEVSALQFEKFTLVVSEDIINARSMTVFLVERINRLNEVLILPYGLSGNLTADVNNIKTINPNLDAVYFGMANMDEFAFTDDYKTAVINTAMTPQHLKNAMNLQNVVGMILRPLFKGNLSNSKNTSDINQKVVNSKNVEFMMKRLNIPKDEIEKFVAFVEDTNFDLSLLESGKEFEFLDLLITQSKIYQTQLVEKD